MLRFLKQYYPLRFAILVLGELAAICISVLIANHLISPAAIETSTYWFLFKIFIITITLQVCLYYNDLYDFNVVATFKDMIIRLLQSIAIACIIIGILFFLFPFLDITFKVFFLSLLFIISFLSFWRFCYIQILKKGLFNQRIILLGSKDFARIIFDEIKAKRDCGYTIAAVALESPDDEHKFSVHNVNCFYRNDYKGLCEMAYDLNVDKIVVALKEQRGNFPTDELLKCRVDGIAVQRGNSFFEMLTGRLSVENINPAWLIYSYGFKTSPLVRFSKRIFDIVLSIIILICTSPLLIIIGILVKLESKGPVLFVQERVGKRRKPYMMYKFRSMVDKAEETSGPVWAQNNDHRVTRIGKFIRKTRIDELPQLWNVLKGEMSLVGPRPEREFFVKGLEYLIPYYSERFAVKPGVTGWAQICYPYGASAKDAMEKLNYDLFYMKNMSLIMDIVIVIRSVKTVIFGKGAR